MGCVQIQDILYRQRRRIRGLTIMMLMATFEDDDAMHSRQSEKCALSILSQLATDTAASAGGRRILILMVGARGFEPPTSGPK